MKGLVAQKTSARPSPRKAPAGPGPRKGGGALAASAAAGPGPPWPAVAAGALTGKGEPGLAGGIRAPTSKFERAVPSGLLPRFRGACPLSPNRKRRRSPRIDPDLVKVTQNAVSMAYEARVQQHRSTAPPGQ